MPGLARIAEQLLETAAADIEFKNGRFTVKGTNHSIGLFEVARAALKRADLPQDLQGPLAAACDETVAQASFPYGCHVCEVEVDPETGVATLVGYAAVDDVGLAVNPLIIHGQIHGGVAQGAGQALLEALPLRCEGRAIARGLVHGLRRAAGVRPAVLCHRSERGALD